MKTLYLSDLDGTLLGSNARLSEFTVQTVNMLIEKGLNFTVATARSMSSAGYILKGINLSHPAIMMNGVFLADTKTMKPSLVNYMDKETARKVIDAFLTADRPPIVYTYSDGLDAEYTSLKNDYEVSFVEARKKLYRNFLKVKNYNIGDKTVYINGIDDKDTIDAVCENLKKIDGIKFSNYLDTYSGDKYFVEVYSKTAGKKNTAETLKKMYGFDRIVMFGDNGNDVELLKAADLAVVVENGQPIAKEAADVIIDTNDNDGVAKFLLREFEKEV